MVKKNTKKTSPKKIPTEPATTRSKSVKEKKMKEKQPTRSSPRGKMKETEPKIVKNTKSKRKATQQPEGPQRKKKAPSKAQGEAREQSGNELKNRPDELNSKLSKAYKWSLRKIWDQMKTTYFKLSDRQNELLDETPFKYLLEMANPVRPNKAIFELLSLYNTKTERFTIAGKELQVTPDDVALILGLPMEGEIEDVIPKTKVLRQPQIDFCVKYFGEVPGYVTCHKVSEALTKVVDDKDVDDMDIVRLVILSISANLLFASSTGYSIPPIFLNCLESMESIKKVSWARAVHAYMMDRIS